ncbi:DUF4173 domain-containing protein [Mesorhizobium sp. 1M-11]|uniref:DUF4153 domain-containing protein n=1 Tax=Mesorhizobium sp. 1M-11 TaxID=1529006 RepID=UPI0006C76CE6|nr:DUF4173 domain-containing protein [Mesorhizobium sp. 1M-11]
MTSLTPKAIAALLLVGAADFLLFHQPDGIALPLFCGLIVVALVATAVRGAVQVRRVALVLAALLPMVEAISPLSMAVALFGLAAFALSLSGRLRVGLAGMARQVGALLLGAPLRLPRDMMRARKAAKRASARSGTIAIWTLSVALGAVFLALFGAANPIIDRWLALLDVWLLLDLISIGRIVFWLVVAALVWALLRPRLPRLPRWLRRKAPAVMYPEAGKPAPALQGTEAGNAAPGGKAEDAGTLRDVIFSEGAILRALVVFNAMFAVQTVLDASYLWGGVALPEGLTYAGYAHRGAYPLIVTALLAAGFVLVTLRPGSALSANRLVRVLVYVWIAQNVVLVISSILRLDLYVGIYSLTYWRVAAFIWMGLVGAGLVLIMARIALGRSNEWLLGANLATLGAVLYACCFINFATIIANYNVMHNREITGQGYSLDQDYLRSLGPAAIPAMDVFLERTPGLETAGRMVMEREIEKRDFLARQQNWRAWGFRNWRLARYLDAHPVPVLVPTP